MKRNRLPNALIDWLDSRGFYFYTSDSEKDGYLTEDEIYSAALELMYDIENTEDGYELYTAQEKAAVKRFTKRESKTHKRISVDAWYWKGEQ